MSDAITGVALTLQAISDAATCPLAVEGLDGGYARISWGDDPLDFIIISPRQVGELIGNLEAVRG
jgi:hypothetical protein